MVHPRSGFYQKDGLEYVSFSTVIGETAEIYSRGRLIGLERWRANEPNWQEITERGQRRGTLIHSEIEAFLRGEYRKHAEDHGTLDELVNYNIHEYMLYAFEFLNKIKEQNSTQDSNHETLLIEEELFSSIGVGGTPDLMGWFEGKYTCFDYKSVRSYKEEGVKKGSKSISSYPDAQLQTACYGMLHNLDRNDFPKVEQGVIAILYDWREPHVHVMDADEVKKNAGKFIERYRTYCAIVESVFPRPLTH